MKSHFVYATAFSMTAIFVLCIAPLQTVIPVRASVERSALESIDLHLEECIKMLKAGYVKNGLSHCEISEQELNSLLDNTTAGVEKQTPPSMQ